MEKSYCVYCHTNTINGKQYIGITCQKPESRWNNGKGYSHNSYMRRAIDKYGWDKFDHKILFTNLSVEEAERLEIRLIKELRTLNPLGYNAEGGGNINKYVTPETRAKQRKAHLGIPLSEERRAKLDEARRRPRSEETKNRISKANKGKPGSNLGKKFSDDHKRKISESKYKSCICVETGVVYDSVIAAAKDVKGTSSGVSSVLTGVQKTHRGYHFIFKD